MKIGLPDERYRRTLRRDIGGGRGFALLLALLGFALALVAETSVEAQDMVYRAEISAADRVNSRGAPLRTLREFLRQDRYNVHSGRNVDPGDSGDSFFGNARARDLIDSARLSMTSGLERDVAGGRVSLLEVAVSRAGNRLEIEVRPAAPGAIGGGGAPMPAAAPAPDRGAPAPEGAVVYWTEISEADRVNSRGAPLRTLREFLRQDRFNVHSGRHSDPGDTGDPVFASPEARALIDGARLVTPGGLEEAVTGGQVRFLEVAVSQVGGRLEIHVHPAEDAGGPPMVGGVPGADLPGSVGATRIASEERGEAPPHVPEGYHAIYSTTLGRGDLVDSNGEPLSRLRDVLVRDRMRVNFLGEPDPGDERDEHFATMRQLRQFFEQADLFLDPTLLHSLRAREATRVAVYATFDKVLFVRDPAAVGEVETASFDELIEAREFEAGAMAAARVPEAEAALRELVEISELAEGRAHEQTVRHRVRLADFLLGQGREEDVRDALPGIERDFRAAAGHGVEESSIYPVMGFVANAWAALGDPERAEALFAELLDEPGSRRWRLGEESIEQLAALRAGMGGAEDAESAFRWALARFRSLDGDVTSDFWARLEAMSNAVSLHPSKEESEFDELRADFAERVASATVPAGGEALAVLSEAMLVLVMKAMEQGEFEEVRRWCEAGIALPLDPAAVRAGDGAAGHDERRRFIRENLPGIFRNFHLVSLVALGEVADAERLAADYFEWAKASYPVDHEVVYNLGLRLIEFFVDRGDVDAMEEVYGGLADAAFAEENLGLAMRWHQVLTESLFALGDSDRGDRRFEQLVAALEESEAMRLVLPEVYRSWGHLHEGAGRYGRAEALWTEGAERSEDDPELLESYLNLQQDLSLIRKHYRDEEGAVAILERARDLAAERLGTDSQAYAISCNNLVLVLHNLGRRDEALRMSDESLRVAAAHRDREWGDVEMVSYRNNRGVLLMGTDAAAGAELFQSVVSAAASSPDSGGENLTFYLMNLGFSLNRTGRVEEAEAAYARALEVMRSFVNPYGRNLAFALDQLAKFALARGDAETAAEYAREAVATAEAFFESASAFASESERLALGSLFQQGGPIHILVEAGSVEEACQISLRLKGVVLDRSIREARAIRSLAEDDEARRLFEALRARQRQVNRVALELERSGASDPSSSALASLRQEVRQLESELLEQTDAESAATAAGLAEVRRRLGDDGVFLEFVVATDERGEDYLGAFEITHETLRWVRLESAEAARVTITEFRSAIDVLMEGDEARQAEGTEGLESAARALYEMLWAPFEQSVAGRGRVVLSPDGPLHFVPFSVLIDGEGRFVGEDRVVEYVVSARDFCREEDTTERILGAAVVVGGPDYAAPLAEEVPEQPVARLSSAVEERDGERRRAFSGIARAGASALAPLPGAEREAGLIAETLSGTGFEVNLLTAGLASERAVADAKVPGILHIATHGIFFDLGFDSLVSGEFSVEVDPMLRGALALAGADNALRLWEAGSFPDPDDDGWLFAYEAAQLDLSGTALVTLSACDTGVGSIAAGEGVVGLRRAFLAAGAGSVLSTLWPIADEYTVALMREFYREVGDGIPVAEAFSAAQGKALAEFREQGESAMAILLFGAFVLNTSG